MADIAAIFHWSHSEMSAFDLDELLVWHDRAVTRYKTMNTPKKS